jgi:thiamine-phosphate pyrophosphorylase
MFLAKKYFSSELNENTENMTEETQIYRVIDANLNRLREGLRVCEEYFRFMKNEVEPSKKMKEIRHLCKNLEECFEKDKLFFSRDSINDPFASGTEAKENERENPDGLFNANIKRAQEAARVVEEFAKLCGKSEAANLAKNIRFELYTFEKNYYKKV